MDAEEQMGSNSLIRDRIAHVCIAQFIAYAGYAYSRVQPIVSHE